MFFLLAYFTNISTFKNYKKKQNKTGSALLTSFSLFSSHLWQPLCSPWVARFPASLVPGPCLTTALPFLKEVRGCLCFTTKEMNQITGFSQGIFPNSGVFSKTFFSDTLFAGSLLKLLWKDLRGSKTWERAWRLTHHTYAPSNEQCKHLCTHTCTHMPFPGPVQYLTH